MTITRSFGIHPGVPWAGPLPGGGYEGKTKRLDRAVERFAEWLRIHLCGPVQIRFNSDRLSGGAFVYPGARGKITFDMPEIGLNARFAVPQAMWKRPEYTWADAELEALPLRYNVLVYPKFLKYPDNLGEYEPGSRFGYWEVPTPQKAYWLLRRLVRPGPDFFCPSPKGFH